MNAARLSPDRRVLVALALGVALPPLLGRAGIMNEYRALLIGAGFAYSANERRNYIGAPQAHIQSTDAKTGQTWTVNRWNDGNPKAGEIAGYTAVGGSAATPQSLASFSIR